MNPIKFGIDIVLNAAGAMGGLGELGRRLTGLQGPGRVASAAFADTAHAGQEATDGLVEGFHKADESWSRLGERLDMPLTLGGIWAAVSGITSLKDVIIGANAELETAQTRMAGSMRNWNDTAASSMVKSKTLLDELRKYSMVAPFRLQPLVDAASIASQVSRTSQGVLAVTKLGTRLAAFKGTNDPTWSTQAIVSAMSGNYTSLNESFGMNVSKEMIESMAARMPGKRTAQGRFEALNALISQRIGKEGPDDVVHQLAKTGMGLTTTLEDQFSIPLTDMGTAGYKESILGLVRFSDNLGKFEESENFKKFQGMMSDRFLASSKQFGAALDFIGVNMVKLPALAERFGPAIKPFVTAAAIVLGTNAAVLALRGGLGLLVIMGRSAVGAVAPFLALVLNPLVIGGVIALAAALYPLIENLNVGGQTIKQRWGTLVDTVTRVDWRSVFMNALGAIRGFLAELTGAKGGGDFFKRILGDQSGFLADIRNMAVSIKTAFMQALVDTFPGLAAPLAAISAGLDRFHQVLAGVGIDAAKFGLVFGAFGLLTRALGLGNPLVFLASGLLRGLAGGIGLVELAIANPLLAAGFVTLLALLSPLTRDMQVFGHSVADWMKTATDAVASVNWGQLFGAPVRFVRGLLETLTGGSKFSFTDWLSHAFDPGSVFAFFSGLAGPIFKGLLGALDEAFPQLRGWFSGTFGNAGQVIGDSIKAILAAAGPFIDGFMTTVGPTLKAISAVLVPLAGLVWTGLTFAIHELSAFIQTPVGEGIFRVLGMLAGIVVPLLLVGGAAVSAFGAVGGALMGVAARAGVAWRFILSIGTAFGNVVRIGGVVGRAFGAVFGVVGRLFGVLATFFPIIGRIAAFFTGPIGLAIGIIITLVQLGRLLYDHWRPFHNLVDKVGVNIKQQFADIAGGWYAIVGWVQGAPAWFASAWDSIIKAGDRVVAWINGLPAWFASAWDSIVQSAVAFGVRVYNAVTGAFTAFTGVAGSLGTTFYNGIVGALGALPAYFGKLIGGMKDALVGWVSNLPSIFAGLMDALPAPLRSALDWFQAHTAPTPTAAPPPVPSPGARAALPPVGADVGSPFGVSFPGVADAPADPFGVGFPVALPSIAAGGGGAPGIHGPISISTPLTYLNASGMTPEEVHAMTERALRNLLPDAINKAFNGVRA